MMFEKGGESSAEDIPKQDLLNLCVKLNKRMKSLESKGQETIKKYHVVLEERDKLMELITVTTGIPLSEGESGDIDHIKDILLHHLNSHKIKHIELAAKISELEEKQVIMEKNTSYAGNNSTLERNEDRLNKLKSKLYALDLASQEKDTMIAYLKKKIAMVEKGAGMDTKDHTHAESDPAGKDNNFHNEIDSRHRKLASTVDDLKKKLAKRNDEFEKLQSLQLENEKRSNANALLKAEQEALIYSLRNDLKKALNAKEESDIKLRELEEYRLRTEGKIGNLHDSKDKLSRVQAELDEANSVAKRLHNRLHTAETNLAERTVEMASIEAEVLALQSSLKEKHKQFEDATEVNKLLKSNLVTAEGSISMQSEKHEHLMSLKQNELNDIVQRNLISLNECKKIHETEINNIKKGMEKNVHTAQLLVEEKSEVIRTLTERNSALKDEVESGNPTDRKIFELASRQATREAKLNSSRDARELAFQQLQNSLAAKDLDLAKLQDCHSKLMAEVIELRCIKSRETVNMDYLKNIILQYMIFPSTSPERAGLVPVISLLLQFSKEEVSQVMSGTARESLLWSSRPIKELKLHPSRDVKEVVENFEN